MYIQYYVYTFSHRIEKEPGMVKFCWNLYSESHIFFIDSIFTTTANSGSLVFKKTKRY